MDIHAVYGPLDATQGERRMELAHLPTHRTITADTATVRCGCERRFMSLIRPTDCCAVDAEQRAFHLWRDHHGEVNGR